MLPSRLKNIYTMADLLRHPWRLIKPETTTPVTLSNLADHIRRENKRIIYFGETHEESEIIKFQFAVLNVLVEEVKATSEGRVKLIMEHFNMKQQPLLDAYLSDQLNEAQLVEQYAEGEEGFDITKYSSLLEFAKANTERVQIVGGFLPRSFGRIAVKEGKENAGIKAIEEGFISGLDELMDGTDEHYNLFESLISGRNLRENFEGAMDNFRKIFPAQTIKDDVMASVIRRNLEKASKFDKFIVISGSGHLDHRFGVPERVDRIAEINPEETCLITVRQLADPDLATAQGQPSFQVNGFQHPFPGDFVLLYIPDEENEELIKSEISSAYDKVASSAHMEGNLRLASKVMTRIGYTAEQIETAGMDAYNYQGVGCPHKHAHIKPGDRVLDVGSGLGVDSFIAAAAVGPHGSVIGLDISKGEVIHANERKKARNASNVEFVHGDMQSMPLDDDLFDVVISNGAFCLAPDKEKAFREIYRVLKPGGRYSVACTVLLQTLDSQVEWPICMRVFMPLSQAIPMLEKIGFENIKIDESDSKMNLGIELDQDQGAPAEGGNNAQESHSSEGQSRRTGVHVGSEEFSHLSEYNMDNLCARIILVGEKPARQAS